MQNNKESLLEYAQLKEKLLLDKNAFKKPNGYSFSDYNLGKDEFIRKVLENAGFNAIRFLKVAHFTEIAEYKHIAESQNIKFDHINASKIQDQHFILCKGTKIIAISSVEFLKNQEAKIKYIIVDTPYHNENYDTIMLDLLKKWIEKRSKILQGQFHHHVI